MLKKRKVWALTKKGQQNDQKWSKKALFNDFPGGSPGKPHYDDFGIEKPNVKFDKKFGQPVKKSIFEKFGRKMIKK